MNIASTLLVLLMVLATAVEPASAQSKSGVEKLYIINCGEGVAANVAIWSPGVTLASRSLSPIPATDQTLAGLVLVGYGHHGCDRRDAAG